MSIILFILIILAGFHLWVENVVVPFCEDKIRYKITNLIVKLRAVKIDPKDKEAKDVVEDLQQVMFKTILTLGGHNIFDFLLFTRKNKHRKHEFESRYNRYLEVCNRYSEIKQIQGEYNRMLAGAFIHTMSGWSIYVLPFAGLIALIRSLFSKSGNKNKEMNSIENFKRYKEFEANQRTPTKLTPARELAHAI